MKWLMIVLAVGGGRPALTTVGPFESEGLCLEAAERVKKMYSRYVADAACVLTNNQSFSK